LRSREIPPLPLILIQLGVPSLAVDRTPLLTRYFYRSQSIIQSSSSYGPFLYFLSSAYVRGCFRVTLAEPRYHHYRPHTPTPS
jgi:hypothetical protein